MQHNILLLQPPMHHPGLCEPSGIRGLQVLEGLGHRAELFDAGLDFYHRFLLDGNRLSQTMALLNERLPSGALSQADAATGDEGHRIAERVDRWRHQIEEVPAAVAGLQSEDFFEPSRAAADLQLLDDMLALVSTAYHPARFSRCGFHHPGLNHDTDVKSFIQDPRLNPFLPYSLDGIPPTAGHDVPELILILVTRAGQVVPAASLLSAWRHKYPGTAVLAAGTSSWLEAVHAAAGISWPGELSPEVARLWEVFQSHWLPEPEVMPDTERGSAGALFIPPGLQPNFAAHPLHADAMPQIVESASQRPEKTMVWEDPRGEFKSITRHLYISARQGYWNHLVLPDSAGHPLVESLINFASANPNIVHSWCLRAPSPSRFADPLDRSPHGSGRYGDTAPLPGRPFWQLLQDPIYLSAYQQRMGAKTLMQLRLDPVDSQVYEIGSQLIYHFVKPGELPEGYLDEICRMVEAGGSVGTQWLRHNLERAFLIAYVEERGVIVGNSSLKHPRREYIEAVSQQTGLDLRAYLERGYTSVRPEYRGFGIGARLLEGLTQRAAGHKIFSIIGEDNIATQKMAIRNKTCKVASFMSRKVGKEVGVWIPEWMLPEGIVLPPQPEFGGDPTKEAL